MPTLGVVCAYVGGGVCPLWGWCVPTLGVVCAYFRGGVCLLGEGVSAY